MRGRVRASELNKIERGWGWEKEMQIETRWHSSNALTVNTLTLYTSHYGIGNKRNVAMEKSANEYLLIHLARFSSEDVY
jgi:hypothetical protein